MKSLINRFIADDSGATAIEYGLIASMVAIIAIGALTAFGQTGSGVFNTAMNAISTAIANAD